MTATGSISPTAQEEAVGLVLAERQYQDAKWGGNGFDDTNSPEDWARYIVDYLSGPRGASYSFAKRVQKVAALGLAALEAEIRAGRRPE